MQFAQQPQGQIMQINIPQGCVAGQMLQIQAPGGQLMQVQIPQGLGPGMSFNVQMPAAPQPQQPQQPQQSSIQQQCNQLFIAVDTDRSGKIDKSELQQALSSGGYNQFQERTAVLLIKMHDTDGSGTIDQTEFVGLWTYLMQWKQSFNQFDTDGSGSIDHQELTTALNVCGYSLSPNVVNDLIQKYDADSSGAISFDEYIQLHVELQILTAAFKKRDVSRQGRITLDYQQFLSLILESRV